jgi:nucleoside-diphosphate-sugar epimerase
LNRQIYIETFQPSTITNAQKNKKKFYGNRDASQIVANRRTDQIANGSLNSGAAPISFTTVTDINVERQALHRMRSGGSSVPAKVTNKNITIYGDGEQIRSFCFVDDLISGITKLFFKSEVHEPINLGNPSPINMKDLAIEIIKLTKSKSEIIHLPLPSDDPLTRIPDISRAENKLGWSPSVERREGLQRTIKYFADELNVAI